MINDVKALIGYAIGTENDAVAMYRYMIRHLPREYAPVLKHILKEEKEHARELIELLNRAKLGDR
jgi:rubrerythrin